jgi:hypothetical protein
VLEYNTRYPGSNARPFHWLNAERTEAEWQSCGQGMTGTFLREEPGCRVRKLPAPR